MDAKIKTGTVNGLQRTAFYKRVPKSIVERPKMGFGVPIGAWLRGPLRDWAEPLLERKRLRNGQVFNEETVRKNGKITSLEMQIGVTSFGAF